MTLCGCIYPLARHVSRSLVAGPVLPGGRVLGRGRHECGPGQRVDEGRRRLGRPYQRYIIVLPYG